MRDGHNKQILSQHPDKIPKFLAVNFVSCWYRLWWKKENPKIPQQLWRLHCGCSTWIITPPIPNQHKILLLSPFNLVCVEFPFPLIFWGFESYELIFLPSFLWGFAELFGSNRRKAPPSLLSLCLGVVGCNLEDIIDDLAEIALTFPADIKVQVWNFSIYGNVFVNQLNLLYALGIFSLFFRDFVVLSNFDFYFIDCEKKKATEWWHLYFFVFFRDFVIERILICTC